MCGEMNMQAYKRNEIYEEKKQMEIMNELLMKLLLAQLSSMGLISSNSLSRFQAQTKLPDFYNKWLEVSLDFLEQEHYIKQVGETFHLCDQALIAQELLWEEWDSKKHEWLEDSNTKAKVTLVETMLRALPDILNGTSKATEIMFPHSSMQLVEGIYKHNKIADYFNNVLAQTVISYIQEQIDRNSNAKIRILEIGAGSGGTSATVLQKLTPYHDHIQEYCYTDISKAFLMHGAREYGPSNPFLTYKILNINESIMKQNIDIGTYDVVIAANVLHATPNIHQTIRHAKALLKRNGVIVINEITEKTLFNHLTFGLLEGWWLYEDTALRIPGCPGLCAKGWKKALTVEGFTSVLFPAIDAEELGQQIFVAKSDGLIRHKQDIQKQPSNDQKRDERKHVTSNQQILASTDQQGIEPKMLDYVMNMIIQKISESLLVDIQMINHHESFSDYGVDSITGVKLVQVINQAMNITLDTTTLFDYSSVNLLASHIISEYRTIIMQQLFQNVEQNVPPIMTLTKESKNQEGITSQPVLLDRIESTIGVEKNKTDIAIIGMSGRFAKSETVYELWEHLAGGNDLVGEVSRWDLSRYDKHGMSFPQQGSFVDDIDRFDPLFFNISGSEAEYMDPQQRIFLEETWKALEDAGYAGAGVQGKKCGIYVGCGANDYQQLLGHNPPPQAFWGTANSIIPARIAYYLNLQGPAIAVDTACSSSLVAIHLACQGLWTKETEMALAGGVFIQSTPGIYQFTNRAGMLSPTGRCYTFDERADGFVLGEGAGVVVLKRLSDAIADGDHIYGVIRGSAINQDGTTNGITAPSAKSQERLEREVYDTFHIDPQHIQMVEAHGTGTKLGDPIEYKALTRAFSNYTNEKNYCAIGSIKSNIGHLTFAAGVAGLIKILLSLQQKQIPPTLHYEKGNTNINFEDSPFYVNTKLTEWSVEPNMKRCAAISSFGFSGTNAHMVIEEAPYVEKASEPKPGYLITLSARTQDQLHQQVKRLIQYCEHKDKIDYGNMSYTLLMGRKHCNHRLACVVHEQNELVDALKKWIEKGEASEVYASVLDKKEQQEQIAMKQYGNEYIRKLTIETDGSAYIGHLSTLAALYTQGYELEFDQMFLQNHYSRISLPTYPFAKERYWIPEEDDQSDNRKHIGKITLEPVWKEQEITQRERVPNYHQHIVMLCEPFVHVRDQLVAQTNGITFISLHSENTRLEQRFESYAVQAFETVQQIVQSKPEGNVLIQIVGSYQGEQQVFSGLVGLLQTARLENPKIIGQMIEVEQGIKQTELIEKIRNNKQCPEDKHIRYEQGSRWVACWNEREGVAEADKIPWKDHGVYLITGGAGGLGRIFAKEIVQKSKNVTVILTGRSELREEKTARLRELQSVGARVIYRQIDITKKDEVEQVVKQIQEEFGSLNGIIHSAGIIQDNYILKKNTAEVINVLSPKVAGTIYLDEATKDIPLDFFLLFSSMSGAIGNPGQADYAMGNAFIDYYAEYRNQLADANERKGLTFSINWPLWKEGGMHVPLETEKMLLKNTGMIGIDTKTGIENIYQMFTARKNRLVLMEGDLPKLRAYFLTKQVKKMEPSIEQSVLQIDKAIVEERTQTKLKTLLGEQLKISVDQIDASETLDQYGIDSLVIIELNQKLEGIFGECSKTIFYEYQTVEEVTKYFTLHHLEQCMKWTGIAQEMSVDAKISDSNHSVEKALPSQISSKGTKRFPSHVDVPMEQKPEPQTLLEPIAIIGMSGHYPQANTLQQYWNNLAQGKDCIVEIPEERWSMENFYDANRKDAFAKGKSYSKWGGFLQDFASFDPLFFSISPREAMNMDPQERLFIQTCWEALEDAGYTREQLAMRHKGRVGVFAGITKTGFQLYGPQLWEEGEELFPYTSFSSIANRVSYLLNLKGPSMPIDTMCSSSLTAIHEACEHIRHGACEMAIVGGVNLYVHPSNYIQLCGQQMLSAEGKCKSFGQAADGFVPGEGVGAFLLKPLSKALEDGDQVHALIRATSINHGGKTNGYTVPNPVAQGELVREAMEKAGINARTISYIEAHGTGTELGDPIEITGLHQAFSKDTQDTNFCAIGSVKSNIGHLEAAAGIAGLTKIILQMKNQKLVPSLHAKELNPNINFAKTPFTVQQELSEWLRPVIEINGVTTECPRIAGISSFGAGGANAHVIVEEFIPSEVAQSTSPHQNNPVILVLSAKNEDCLQEQVNQLLAALQEKSYTDRDLKKMAYTLQVGREAMEERLGMIVESIDDLEEKLKGYRNKQANLENVYQGKVKQNKETVSIFLQDEELQEAIQKWIKRKKYAKLLRLWVKGLQIDWNKLYGENKPQKMSLPTYPFTKEQYWISPSRNSSTSTFVNALNESSHHSKLKSRTDCIVKKYWKLANVNKAKELHGTIAILTTNETEPLAKRISERMRNTKIMKMHEIPAQLSHSQEEWKKYAGIIDLAGCGSKDQTDTSWIFTLQTLIGLGKKEDVMLLCVTKGLEAFKNGSINVAGATRVGLYRTLQSEYSYVCSRHMDVEGHLEDHVLAEQIIEELFAESQDVEVCYRDGQRYRAYLDVVQDEIDTISQKQVFPSSHVLWITGGTRGLGLLCAKHFVKNYGVKRIVLTGRESLPSREEWDLYKEHHSSTAQKIRAIEQLESLGAEIQVFSVALSDEEEVRKCVEQVKLSMGSIGGVIHCAGSVDMENPAFIRKSSETINQVMEPKIQGLRVLYRVLKEEPLQFFVLFSSVSAIVPSLGAGQSDYAMANAYMDYFSESVAHSCPIVSIQWPSWKETGMGEVKSSSYEQSGMLSMTNKEGLSFLDRILAKKLGPVVLPAIIHAPIWKPEMLMQTKRKAGVAGVQHAHMRLEVVNHGEVVHDELMEKTQSWLLALFSKELMLDSSLVDTDSLFQEYGMDSILLAQIITKMDRELKIVALDPSILLEHPSIGRLTTYLIETYPDVLESLFSIEEKKTSRKAIIENDHNTVSEVPHANKEHEHQLNGQDKIAVIGIACHFPDARNAREYWANLKIGKDSIREIPKSRWDIEKLYTSNDYTEGKSISKWGGFLDSIEDFDPDYFHIPESLAYQIDPLQRQLLEVSAEAILDAGYQEKDLWNKQVGVFVGSRASTFSQKLEQSTKDTIVGTGQNFIAAHVAHVYNFKGPNMVIDTACSSSLTAIHLAVRSIQNGESELALAGGVDILLDESPYVAMSAANVLSRDGRCKTFSAEANGIGLGEGCGVLILKPLQQAIRDQNKIYGVIEGSSINNDGNTMGITTPNPEAQKELIEKAIVDAKINPETISYVETHGTGTLIGDPIELKALTQVCKKHTLQKQYCGVGSVKSNIGHLMSAAGVASFIKVLLSLVHEELPATLHCEHPNPRFHFEESPFFIVQEPMKWVSKYAVLRAGISAFGLGGNNAHIIVSNEGIPLTHRVPLESINPNISFQRKRYWPEGKQDSTKLQKREQDNRRTAENLAYYEPIRVEHRGE